MIVNARTQTFSRCFEEADVAVRAMTDRVVAFNAHRGDAPPGAVIYQTEYIPHQVPDFDAFMAGPWKGREIWDVSERNLEHYPPGTNVKHVPLGYHPSMERFKRAKDLDIDVIFTGAISQRRADVLNALRERGLNVVVVPVNVYGRSRDALLARAKLALNMLFREGALFPQFRAAHLIANEVPMVSEAAADEPSWVGPGVAYQNLVDAAYFAARGPLLEEAAGVQLRLFRAYPMVLPS